MRPAHLRSAGSVAVAAAFCVLVLGLDIVWFFAAGLVLLVCSLGAWLLERRQRFPER